MANQEKRRQREAELIAADRRKCEAFLASERAHGRL
jgi:hypothetical protein